jgi:lysophospholipase L1-like esterase
MRSEDVAETPPPGATRILFLGDSVTWGGAYEDQSTTFPYLVAKDLDAMKWGPVETLNPSCGGWAPGNELGWLKGHGTFKSRLVVLVINEGDLDQPKEADVSGRHPNYPRQASVFALQELMSRYVLPRITHSNTNDPGSQQGAFDAAAAVESRRAVLDEIDLAQKRDAKVIVLFTKRDPADPKDNWVPAMADKLRATVQRHGARFVVANLTTHAQYHDGLHPNALGNQAIASQLARIIPQVLGQSPATTSRK